MKKLLCTLLAIAMLCSFMVVNVSAEYYYEGIGFGIDFDIAGQWWESDSTYKYETAGAYVDVSVICYNNQDLVYEQYIYDYESASVASDITIDGREAYIEGDMFDDGTGDYYCFIGTHTEHFLYWINIYGTNWDIFSSLVYNVESMSLNEDDYYLYYAEDEYYEDDYTEGFYEEPTDDMVSTYWETDTFYIDTDMELVMVDDSEYYVEEGAENYCFWPAEVDGEYVEDDAGSIDIMVYHPDDADELYQEYEEMLYETCEDSEFRDNDRQDIENVKIGGYDAVQYTFIKYEGEFSELLRFVAVSDGENVYLIEINCPPEFEGIFDDLCDIVENDLHFNNAPADDDKAEDKADNTNKDDKDTEDKKDAEEKDNSTVIIIVAVVAGVVVLGVVAIVVLGKKKKQ